MDLLHDGCSEAALTHVHDPLASPEPGLCHPTSAAADRPWRISASVSGAAQHGGGNGGAAALHGGGGPDREREREAARILNPAATAYEVLGVPPNATHEQIAAQHRELQKRAGIRTNTETATSGQRRSFYQKIEQAWDTLQEPSRRAKYDQAAPSGCEPGRIRW
ncbi:hypothetical protein EMIHUDRAFT_199016 [Emiliania huxleyi CCMP1516]|uniref:J domain-containing protein n=2 Tax=Emiliania huxleyi TaxID=2903 RepID=A0A0D3I263_EMIH1|nr:hypothetical protein EMIHUDRAFT_199016 [Emiliania huxleyi CCMP1516]EOD05348.1 hypothetical protein EMIHUDRAFT_199016 [Emiliania huxleyi CCMP1516]|eukprot:XP_005757777.1 hypothetical protein EMIHUDRAFT_199016 [Emiliania huxleyi CCMP1516]